ncbi:TonB-dependent receptor [Neolewinella persica]|uniref:TonB-dependent receptor n=1 Tax=Neolewinella persica TaxID=70998 RepID=UPI00037B1EF6|nr:TonB-dependent receptor [Neolewinella persica]
MMRFLFCAALALAYFGGLTGQKVINGIALTDEGEPFIGLSATLEGTDISTTTDIAGKFALTVPPEYVNGFLSLNTGYTPSRVAISSFLDGRTLTLQWTEAGLVPFYAVDEITVTATRATSLTPVTYTNVTKAEIQKRNLGQDAPYLLKWTPSVVVNSDAGTGVGYTGIWIRGSDPTRTNVTINGIPYNDSESQGVFWVNLPDFSSSADNIQIQRGVGTSTNGAGAFGATIDFKTNQISEAPKLSIDGSVGSFGTRRGSVNYTSGLMDSGLKIDARYSQTHSDGYVDRASADLEGYYAGLTYVGADAGAVWRFNAFGGNEVTYQSWNGVTQGQIDTIGRTYNSVGTEKEGEPYDNEVDNYRQNHYQLHYNNEFGGQWSLGLSGHYTRGLGYFEQYKAGEDLADYGIDAGEVTESDLIRRRWLDNHFYGAVYSLRYRPSANLDITFGGSANEYLGDHYGEVIWARNAGDSEIRDRYYDNDAVKRDFSNYLRSSFDLPLNLRSRPLKAYVDLQVRHVNYEFLGFANDLSRIDETATHTFFNPKAGLLYNFTGGQAYASFGVAQREPNRNDYTENPTATRPRPEQLYNTEIGIRKQRGNFNYGANFYHMAYKDQLVVTGELNDVGELIRANVPESYRLGIELEGGYRASRKFTVGGNLALSRNRVRAYTEFLDSYDENFGWLGQDAVEREDTELAFSPSVVGALDLNYLALTSGRHRLEVGLQTKYVGERYVDNSGTAGAALAAYNYTDFRLSYGLKLRRPVIQLPVTPMNPAGDPARIEKPGPSLRFTLLVRNLTDQLYVSNGWSYRFNFAGAETSTIGLYPQAGRNVLLGLGLDF